VLTIPMGFLFGVLLAVGRMNADNEIIAMQAGGIAALRLLRPIVAVGVVMSGVCGYLFLVTIPQANRELRELRTRLFTSAKNIGRIEPRVFYDDFPNLLLYVQQVDHATGTWLNVLAFDSSSPGQERLTLARRGRVVAPSKIGGGAGVGAAAESGYASVARDGESGSEPWILLEEAVTHQTVQAKPETYRVNDTQRQLFRPRVRQAGVIRYNLAMRERDTAELLRFMGGGQLEDARSSSEDERPQQLRLAGLELHRRFAIPAACTVFALLAVPLGIGSRSGGRGRGFVLSVAIVLVYYIMNNNGELLALEGKLPVWLGIWLPNLALTVLSVFLMRRMGRWLGERRRGDGAVARAVRSWRRWRRSRRTDNENTLTGSIPINLQRRRYGGGFPTLLDRHVTRRLMAPLALVVASTALLYVVVDLSDRIDDIGKNDAPLEVVVAYYWNLLPQVLVDVIPFALLIAVLIVLTVLERQQELTAMKAAGISLYRLMVPMLLVAVVGVGAMWMLSESIVPKANREKEQLLDRIKGRTTARSYRTPNRQWLVARDDATFYNFLRYDSEEQMLIRFTMYRVDDDMRLRFHLFAHRVRYVNGSWIADSGWYRRIGSDGIDEFQTIYSPMELGITEGPNYFGQEYRRPSEMSSAQLREYIDELVDSGYRPDQLMVRWHQKYAYPLSALMMVCLALPYGLNRGGRRISTMQGVALALGLGIGYFLMVAVFGKLGEAAVLPAMVGAWSPVVLTVLFSINRMSALRT
jgi:LPS export ABC transporter permease LptG